MQRKDHFSILITSEAKREILILDNLWWIFVSWFFYRIQNTIDHTVLEKSCPNVRLRLFLTMRTKRRKNTDFSLKLHLRNLKSWAHWLRKNHYVQKIWGHKSRWNSAQMNNWHTWQLKKVKVLEAILELPAKQHCQFCPFTAKMGQRGWIGSAV